jgi:cysteine sulfinate desulfinase/cysteine desulfurase-like protein
MRTTKSGPSSLLAEIARIAREAGVPAFRRSTGLGKVAVDVTIVDLYSMSGHKIYAQGVGACMCGAQ